MKKISAKNAIIILLVLAVLFSLVLYFLAGRQKQISYETYQVGKGDIIQTVSETGTVKANSEMNLSFLANGRVQRINFKVGDKVKSGQLISELDYTSLIISKQESQANYDVATQNLNKLLAGATTEERALSEATVVQAQSAYDSAENEMSRVKAINVENIAQAEKTLIDLQDDTVGTVTTYEQAIESAKTNLENTKSTYQQSINNARDSALLVTDDKISSANTALDAVKRIIFDDDIDDYLSIKDPSYLNTAKAAYNAGIVQKDTATSKLSIAKINLSESAVTTALVNSVKLLDYALDALENTFSALDKSVTNSNFSKTDIDSYKSTISTHIVTINAALSTLKSSEQSYYDAILNYNTKVKTAEDSVASALTAYDNAILSAENALSNANFTAEQQITSAESRIRAAKEALEVARAQKDQVFASANKYDITLSRAKIRQAQAALDSINKQIDNSQIKAPIDGVITNIAYEVGEQALQGQAAVSMLGEGGYEIEVHISEADIAKLEVDDEVEITLDAYGDDKMFSGKVSFVEPAETVIQDVIYYLVKINFDAKDTEIKSGMTANLVITTDQKSDTISVPSRAIIDKGSEGKHVKILINNQPVERKVIVGIRGDGGIIEIVDGLKDSDKVIIKTIEN